MHGPLDLAVTASPSGLRAIRHRPSFSLIGLKFDTGLGPDKRIYMETILIAS